MSRVTVPHYVIPNTNLELIHIIQGKSRIATDAWQFFLWASAMQYIWRYDVKGEPLKDLDKALTYLTWLRQAVAGKK